MPSWIFEAVQVVDGWTCYASARHLLDAETQQTLNVALQEGVSKQTFPPDAADAPFTEVCFECQRLIIKQKRYRLIGKWSEDSTPFSYRTVRMCAEQIDLKPVAACAARKPGLLESDDVSASHGANECWANPSPDLFVHQ